MKDYPTSQLPNYSTNFPTAFFGTPRLAQIVLENLIASSYKPSLVITAPDAKFGRGQKTRPSPVKQTASQYGIPTNYKLLTTNYQLDLAILVAYGHIIPKEILDLPKYGFLNVHPSLLPKYRGPSPIQSAILAGDKKTGVTVIKLDEEVDHGQILAQQEIEIEDFDTHETLVEKLGAIGSNLLIKTIPDYLSGKIKPKEQNHKLATFTKKINKGDGKIDLENPPSPEKLDRMIRAFYPWPGVWTEVTLRLTQGDAEQSRSIKVESGKSKVIKFLPKGLIQLEGKKPMTKEEFLNGYPKFRNKLPSSL